MGDIIQRCPCCRTCEECPYFQNVVNVKSAGLLIYRYFCAQGVNIYTGKNESSREIFILQNTKNSDIASEKLIPQLGQYMKCPRCKYILEHAEKILLNIPTVNKLDVLGICDKCRSKDRKGISSCECSEVIKKFIAIKKSFKKEATETIKRQSKLQHRFTNKDGESRTLYVRRSESNLDNIMSHLNSKQKCEPQVNQLTVGKKELREASLTEIQRKRIPIPKTDQKIRFTPKNYSDSKLAELDANLNRYESNIKFKKPLRSYEKSNWPQYDAKPFQSYANTGKEYPLRRISISEESLFFNYHDLIEKSDQQPRPKLDSLRPPTHVQKETKLGKDKEPSILDLIAAQNRPRNENMKKETHEFETRTSIMSDVGTGILKYKKETMSPGTLAKYSSDKAFSSSLLAKTKELLQKDFSYFFIKEAEPIKQPLQEHKSSSELIKDTQDMLLAREEDLRRRNEEKVIRRLNEDEKKRKTSEAKKKHFEESKIVFEKDIQEQEREKNVLDKLDVSSKKTINIGKVSKDVRAMSEKSGTKAEPKSDKTAVLKSKKSQNEEARQVKEFSLKLEKERKLREKENLKREKEDKSKKETREKVKKQSAREEESKEPPEKGKKEKPVTELREKENLKREKEDKSKKETREKFKKQSARGEESKEPSEKGKKEKPVTDKETRKKEKQSEKESETRENEKNEIDRIEKPKYTKEIEEKSEKEKDIDENLKIKKGSAEEKVLEKNKVSADMKTAKEDAALKLKALREMGYKTESAQEQLKPVQKGEEPKIKELNINQVKIRRPSNDDLILQLVKLKQSESAKKRDRARNISEIHIPLTLIADHKRDHKCTKMATCAICNDSELELDIEEIILDKAKRAEINNIIIGQKIFKYKQPLTEKSEEKQTFPIFITTFNDDLINVPKINIDNNISEQLERKPPAVSGEYTEDQQPKGIIRYALSDRTFIEKGWTMLPTEKVVRKMNVYRMRPAHPEFDWFEHNKNKKIMQYDTGEKFAEFDDNGRGRLYYRSGPLALEYYNAEEINAQQRFVIHSSGEADARGCSRPLAILATFDYLGNGIVFDHTGKIRLKYNQTEGVVLDRSIGPVSHWKWHTLNDPPVLQQVMIDTQMAHKDPDIVKLGGPAESTTRPDNEEMLAIEFDNFIKEKSKKLSQKFKKFQIKMKALKISEHFSLRVLDQATIYLIFRDGSTNLKINLGMILDHKEIVDTDTAEVGEVSNSLERFPARTDSLAALQNSVAFAQRVERARVERERRLRLTQPCPSSDKFTTIVSRPVRAPLRTVASEATVATCNCRFRKPPILLYYDTRLL
nr:uncharacterized protein LOC117990060 [Maniola hyperantus]